MSKMIILVPIIHNSSSGKSDVTIDAQRARNSMAFVVGNPRSLRDLILQRLLLHSNTV